MFEKIIIIVYVNERKKTNYLTLYGKKCNGLWKKESDLVTVNVNSIGIDKGAIFVEHGINKEFYCTI